MTGRLNIPDWRFVKVYEAQLVVRIGLPAVYPGNPKRLLLALTAVASACSSRWLKRGEKWKRDDPKVTSFRQISVQVIKAGPFA